MTQRVALITKNYILAYQEINFKDRNFFVRNTVEKNFFQIGIQICLRMHNMTQRDAFVTKKYILAHQKHNL